MQFLAPAPLLFSLQLAAPLPVEAQDTPGLDATPALASDEAPPDTGAAGHLLAGLPLVFVANRGQWNTAAEFVAERGPLAARLERDGVVIQLQGDERGHVLRLAFEGASEALVLEGEGRQPGVRNYFLGDDPEAWRVGVPAFDSVLYRGLHEGLDLRVRDRDGRLEYDLLLAPGADLGRFVVRCEGVEGVAVEADGALCLDTELGPVRQTPPATWYVLPSGDREPVDCRFVLLDENRYGFAIPDRDPSRPVVIDPGLEWSTYLGGSDDDAAWGMKRKASGEILLVGGTRSLDFPTTPGAYRLTLGGTADAFVTCLDASGSSLCWSTHLGGGGAFDEHAMDVEVGPAGEVFVVGITASPTLPTTPDAFQPSFGGGTWDGFVAELSADGSALAYASYLGGSSGDWPARVELRAPRVLTLAGTVLSSDFPTTADALQGSLAGGRDFFVSRMDLDQVPAGQLVYSTYLGGSADEGWGADQQVAFLLLMDLHLDASDAVFVTGLTRSADFHITPGTAYDESYNGVSDVYLTRIDPSLAPDSQLAYSTFLGGASGEGPWSMAVDEAGVVTLGGFTYSSDFPTTPGAYDTTFLGVSGFNDGWILRLDPSLAPADQLLYGTFLGGEGFEGVLALALDEAGRILGTGFTGNDVLVTNSFPTTCGAYSQSFGGQRDGFVLYLDPAGNGASDLLYSSFVGGSGNDRWGTGLAIVPTAAALTVVSAGVVQSVDFPTTPGAFQPGFGGVQDGLVLQLEINPHTYCVAAPNSFSPDGALICGTGSVAVTDNTFNLSVSGAIPGQFGVFYYGPQQYQLPFGNGFRCVGPGSIGVFRLNPPLVIDGTGSASRLVDFTQPPAGSGPGQITAASTWYFQFWYRDPAAGGATFNLSNGLSATFAP